MRKVLAVLLVVGLLIGICCVAADTSEEEFDCVEFTGESGDNGGNPSPCGGGNGNGGGIPD